MKRIAFFTLVLVCLALQVGSASAALSISASVEDFRWRESTSPSLNETGVRNTLGLNWTQDKASGWLAAYRLKYTLGNVDYDGSFLLTATPISGSTHYSGFAHEIQAINRTLNKPVEFVVGLGWDSWQRHISPQQVEDYDIYYIKLGANVNTTIKRGVFGGGGIKYPIYTTEDANLMSIGFDQNPKLHPGRDYSFFGEIGYRFNPSWDLIGYYDSYSFRQSNAPTVTANATFPGASISVFQPKSTMNVLGMKLQYSF